MDCASDGFNQRCRFVWLYGRAAQFLLQTAAFNELQHQEMHTAGLISIVGRDNVRVRQPGRGLCFPSEPFDSRAR